MLNFFKNNIRLKFVILALTFQMYGCISFYKSTNIKREKDRITIQVHLSNIEKYGSNSFRVTTFYPLSSSVTSSESAGNNIANLQIDRIDTVKQLVLYIDTKDYSGSYLLNVADGKKFYYVSIEKLSLKERSVREGNNK